MAISERDKALGMRKIKPLFDPEALLNPGVLITPNTEVHVQNLKLMPLADPIVDLCIECGFCEPACPSHQLTLSPRQRIVTTREMARLKQTGEDPARLATMHPVTAGIVLGLLVGKLAGVFGFTWLAVRLGLGTLPGGIRWNHVFGVALLTGIGFTMSLFIGSLAFPDDSMHGQVRLGVLLASTCAAVAGLSWLRAVSASPR